MSDSSLFLAGKHILLGVTGSIAAYKAGEVVRRLREAGAEVRVIMTAGACEFVQPLTFQALSGNPVHRDLLDEAAEAGMGHIELARWADAILVAPASADFLARLAQGRADDLLAAVCLASEVPLAVAPAMNAKMWANPATADNVRTLGGRGVVLLGPDEGPQACGDTGAGRLLAPETLVARFAELFPSGLLAGRRLVITAGPTREAIDPVRYLSNRSSGKMGFELARAAVEAGGQVVLISGPVSLDTPPGVVRVDVESAQEMYEAVLAALPQAEIFIGAAAVADYRPTHPALAKIKKSAAQLTLELERTPDILAEVKARHPDLFCVGFAAETDELERHARDKLARKGIELVAANRVGPAAPEAGGVFGSDLNALQLFWPGGETSLPLASKARLARQLIEHIATRLEVFRTAPSESAKVVTLGGTRDEGRGTRSK